MIDLRCHILSGTPCGPSSFAESIQMCQAAVKDGAQTLIASPRWEAGEAEPPLSFDKCEEQISRLKEEVGGALNIELGFGLQFSSRLPELAQRYGPRLAVGGRRYIIVSMPSLGIPADAEDVWRGLNDNGFRGIVAHPECSVVIRRQPESLSRWVNSGVVLQIDAGSVAGSRGREIRRFAFDCLQKYRGRVVVASNAHAMDELKHPLSRAREVLVKELGEGRAREVMTETPAEIIGRSRQARSLNSARRGLSSMLRSLIPLRTFIGRL